MQSGAQVFAPMWDWPEIRSWVAPIGGAAGVLALIWGRLDRWRDKRRESEKRLAIQTTRTTDGSLQVDFTFETSDRAEPLTLVVRSRTRGAHLAYNAVATMIADGYGNQVPVGPSKLIVGQDIEAPLHFGASALSCSTTVFVVPPEATDGGSLNIESGTLTIRIVRTSSRKPLICTTRTVSAPA